MTTLHLRTSIGRSPLRLAFLLIPVALACFGLSPIAQAVSPAPDGSYTGANTAEGNNALFSLTTGSNNTAVGSQALFSLTTGIQNTAVGPQALKNNNGDKNTAIGVQALVFNTDGTNNTATGWQALYLNKTGDNNVANGYQALFKNTNDVNTATGVHALFNNTTGDSNNATGFEALFSNTTGVWNEAYGFDALFDNVTGRENTAIGDSAGLNVTGSFNINIGSAVTSPAGENNTIRIGDNLPRGMLTTAACFIGGISGVAAGTDAVFVDSNGQLGTGVPSSARFKTEIKPMSKASQAILALKPVTFRYKKEIDPKTTLRFGLVAEQVEKVNPELVGRDAKGQVNTVRYEAVNAMLLNEFLKAHRKMQKQEATIAQLKSSAATQQKEIKALTASLKEQASQIQKVSAQLEARKPAPQLVVNEQ